MFRTKREENQQMQEYDYTTDFHVRYNSIPEINLNV